jgi:HD-GYP domain-containing protein (c-di-GMP phosphodiesterase class II)
MVAFARGMKLPRETVKELALGALLHDVGKACVPDEILNKPGKLNDDEFERIKSHVDEGVHLLRTMPGLGEVSMQVISQHHERFDGTGYPHAMSGKQISLHGQMAAIVDVYDAISSERVYHRGMSPTQALKKLLEWSNHHFEPRMVQIFIRAVGIYPTGSLVKLESGKLGVVMEQNDADLLHPTVRTIFSTIKNCYLQPTLVDLRKSEDRIVSHEDYEKWNINPKQWLPTP